MEYFTIINFVLVFLGLLIGFVISKFLEKTSITKSLENAKKETENILKSASIEGENIKKDKIFQAKEKFLELKSEHEKHILSREKNLTDVQKRIKDKESQVSNELSINKKNNQNNLGTIKSSNLCVHQDTLILTKDGYYPIKDLANKEVEIWNGSEFSLSPVRKTNVNQELLKISGVKIYGTSNKTAVISFNVAGIHPYDIGSILDKLGIAVRTGHHCAQPLMTFFDVSSTARASIGLYSQESDFDVLATSLEKVNRIFG